MAADAGDYPVPRFIGIGFLKERIVVVVFNEPNESTIRIISLRKALKHERTHLRNSSETNWERIDKMVDEDIDTSDVPPLDGSFFSSAKLRMPEGKVPVLISVDSDVMEWFKTQDEYQELINSALRVFAETHKI